MGIGLIAVAKNQVMFVVPPDGIVSGFAVLLRQGSELISTGF